MKLDIRHLRLIVAITEDKSVTRAGKSLNLTQSALSHQLRDIEERLGTPLFLRVNKRMILTQAGERLLLSAKAVLKELTDAEEDLAQMAGHRKGALRLSTECFTCYHWLPALFSQFNARYPEVEVRVLVEATSQPVGALLAGELDLAIVHSPSDDRRLVARPLFKDEMVAVMSPQHPLAGRSFISPADFADEHLILHSPLKESAVYQQFLLPARITPARVSQVQLTEVVIEMVKAGLGMSFLARWTLNGRIESNEIVALPLSRKGFFRCWSALRLRRELPSPYLDYFIDLLARNTPEQRQPSAMKLRTMTD